MKTKLKLHLLLLALLSLPAWALAQGTGTAFSYQGRLVENDVPVSGLYDFIFTVYDAEAEGSPLGGPLPLNGITVSVGLFAAPLDFGEAVFTGAPRWLEIGVRVNGSGPHTPLVPRQALLSTPYAIHAESAGTVANGTVTADQLNTGLAPAPGQFLSYDGGSLVWSDPGVSAIFSLNGTSAYYTAGNVGIGTTSPETKLAVFSSGYGIEHTDGTRRLSSYLSATGGWFGTRSSDPLNFFVNDGNSSMTISLSGSVGIGTTTPVAKLHTETPLANTSAVYGKATGSGGAGVYGESAQFNGVRGLAHNANHGGVVGVHDGGGIAVYGTGAVGVQGDGTSVGVYGRSTSGPAIHAEGNATQARDKGGFVKAMAYIDPFLPADQYVVRSYNSQPGATITVTRHGEGNYSIDFGFNVQDRFISVTLLSTQGTARAGPDPSHPNSAYVGIQDIYEEFEMVDSAFTIFVF